MTHHLPEMGEIWPDMTHLLHRKWEKNDRIWRISYTGNGRNKTGYDASLTGNGRNMTGYDASLAPEVSSWNLCPLFLPCLRSYPKTQTSNVIVWYLSFVSISKREMTDVSILKTHRYRWYVNIGQFNFRFDIAMKSEQTFYTEAIFFIVHIHTNFFSFWLVSTTKIKVTVHFCVQGKSRMFKKNIKKYTVLKNTMF